MIFFFKLEDVQGVEKDDSMMNRKQANNRKTHQKMRKV